MSNPETLRNMMNAEVERKEDYMSDWTTYGRTSFSLSIRSCSADLNYAPAFSWLDNKINQSKKINFTGDIMEDIKNFL